MPTVRPEDISTNNPATTPVTTPTLIQANDFRSYGGKYSMLLGAAWWDCSTFRGGSVQAYSTTYVISQNKNEIFVSDSKVVVYKNITEVKSTSDISGQVQRDGKFLLRRNSSYVLTDATYDQVYIIEGKFDNKIWSGWEKIRLTKPDDSEYLCILNTQFTGDLIE